jgi:hypothetical protein
MLGFMLDRTVFNAGVPSRISTYLKPFPQRASLIVLVAVVIVTVADLSFDADFTLIPAVALGVIAVLSVGTLMIWNHPFAFSPAAWVATAMIGAAAVGFTSSQFLSSVAKVRSVHFQSQLLLNEEPDLSVVYFGEKAYASSLYLPQEKVSTFSLTQVDEFASFLDEHPHCIVVTADDMFEIAKETIAESSNLIPVDSRQHVYLAYPADDGISRVAQRADQNR